MLVGVINRVPLKCLSIIYFSTKFSFVVLGFFFIVLNLYSLYICIIIIIIVLLFRNQNAKPITLNSFLVINVRLLRKKFVIEF